MAWPDDASLVNTAKLDVFGGPFQYSQVPGDYFTVNGVRGVRDSGENTALAPFERFWSRLSEFPMPPRKGDVTLLGDQEYVVHEIVQDRDPASDGLTIYLNRRRQLAPSA